ncbi:MAG: hypothetical protein P4L69_19000 [Desulfosporosinus sp.]|nr:hypothetical protein [Desulfosporosinus sp.]
MSIFDDGMTAEDLAMILSLADQMAEEERDRLESSQENEPLVPDDDAPEWFERD